MKYLDLNIALILGKPRLKKLRFKNSKCSQEIGAKTMKHIQQQNQTLVSYNILTTTI
jgi:hypothetical protein